MRAFRAIRTLFLAFLVAVVPASSFAGVFVSITVAPPVLPVYAQPVCPGDGYLWTPGYWAYGPAGYFWVPGTWVLAPRPGFLWTPGYWGFGGGLYAWHAGYWGPHVGFYGGVNYGYGYGGSGFYGGRWEGEHFAYNAAVLHVNTTVVHNTYVDRTVIHNTTIINNRTSFNGPGGVNARPNGQEQAAMRESRIQPTSEQITHENTAATNRSNFASVNGGRPVNAAVSRPLNGGNVANHTSYNSNSRPEYNNHPADSPSNNTNHQAYNAGNNNSHPAYNANNHPENVQQPHANYSEPPHQGGGQPHNAEPPHESHPNNGGGGHEGHEGGGGHERR
jgi:WXXGXW repeat (2 copies)